MRRRVAIALGASLCAGALSEAGAATLPAHSPLGILVISDEVNPHGLSGAQLTQPGDIEAALEAPNSGLSLIPSGVQEVSSQCVDTALASLTSSEPPNVVVYFAHQSAKACGGADRQNELTSAMQQLLVGGGGVVVFHHGLFVAAGKSAILQLLGGSASSIAWDTTTGQRVFNVGGPHFVSSNGLQYTGTASLANVPGVPNASYPYFDNIPDERYPATTLLTEPGETRTLLFATSSGTPRVLGYALTRAGWTGTVVAYQPGEYQPNALDDKQGPNFQILANAIVYAAGETGAAGSGGAGGIGGAAGSAGASGSGGASGNAGASGFGGAGGSGGASGSAGAGASGGTSGNAGAGASGGSGGGGTSGAGGDSEDSADGCSCNIAGRRSPSDLVFALLAAAGALAARSRRARRQNA